MLVARLTTVDNPWDPFEEFPQWYQFDVTNGYKSTDLLGRVIMDSHETSVAQQNDANTQAIDEIVAENVSGMHRKVTREVPDP